MYIGVFQEGQERSLCQLLEKANDNGYAVIVFPMDGPTTAAPEPQWDGDTNYVYPDLIYNSYEWNAKIICKISDTIECDSQHEGIRRDSSEVLKRQIAWAEHLQLSGYTMTQLRSERNYNLARLISAKIKGEVLIRVPLYLTKNRQNRYRSDIEELESPTQHDTWRWWHIFHKTTDYNSKIKVSLEFSEDGVPSMETVRRWLGEPVESVVIPSSLFTISKNCPKLQKAWLDILAVFMTHLHVNVIIWADANDTHLEKYTKYLLDLESKYDITANELKKMEDVLQQPLQPLYDNLDCATYETFEKDPVKYKMYQNAVVQALVDRVPDELKTTKLTIVMVLGAGRGPLVRAVLNASRKTERKVRIYVIEKNENAIRTLTCMAKTLWNNDDVHIFSKDMRKFAPPEKADILVSELLGSFGDNELSPECLDCAQRLLKPDGISIPYKYTSYINPIMSTKLYNAVRSVVGRQSEQACVILCPELVSVVMLKNVFHIDEPKPLFEFMHPNRNVTIDNSRFKTLRFDVPMDCMLNGLGGYFDADLYKDIKISIVPQSYTLGMSSWYPMYFPFSHPIDLKMGDTLEIVFWRCVSKQKIWYEWGLNLPTATHNHNPNGRSYSILC